MSLGGPYATAEKYHIPGPMSHFRFRAEVVVAYWRIDHSTRNDRLSHENIMNHRRKMSTSGFIA